jgi:hypothetical protein
MQALAFCSLCGLKSVGILTAKFAKIFHRYYFSKKNHFCNQNIINLIFFCNLQSEKL